MSDENHGMKLRPRRSGVIALGDINVNVPIVNKTEALGKLMKSNKRSVSLYFFTVKVSCHEQHF